MVTGNRLAAVIESAAAKVAESVPFHELTSAEWAVVRAQHRIVLLERLAGGRRPGNR